MKTPSLENKNKLHHPQPSLSESSSASPGLTFAPPVSYPHEPSVPIQQISMSENSVVSDEMSGNESGQFHQGNGFTRQPGEQISRLVPEEVVQYMLTAAITAGTDSAVMQLLNSEEAAELKVIGYDDEALVFLHGMGLSFAQSKHAYEIGFDSSAIVSLSKISGLTLAGQQLFDQILFLHSAPQSLTAEEIVRSFSMFKGDVKSQTAAHTSLSPEQVHEGYIKERYPDLWLQFFEGEARNFHPFALRFSLQEIEQFATTKQKAADLAPLLDLDLDFEQIKLLLGQNRFFIPELVKLLSRFDIGQIHDLTPIAEAVSVDQMLELDSAGLPFDVLKTIDGTNTAQLAARIKQKIPAISFSSREIQVLFERNFRIQGIVALSKAKESNPNVSIATILKLNDHKLSPSQITSAAQSEYFVPDFLKALLATGLMADQLIALRKANYFSLPEIVTLTNKFQLAYPTIREAEAAGISYQRIQLMAVEAQAAHLDLNHRRIIDFGPTPISMASVKTYLDEKRSHEWIVAKAKSGFSKAEVDQLRTKLPLKNIGRIGQHYSAEQIKFLLSKGFGFDHIQQLSSAGISYEILGQYLSNGATPPDVLQLTGSGFLHSNIVALYKETKNMPLVAALAATGFSFDSIVGLKATGFPYADIIAINRDTKLPPAEIAALKESESNVTTEEIIWRGRTGFSIADLRILQTKGLTLPQLMRLSDLGYSVAETSQLITLLKSQSSDFSFDQIIGQIELLKNTRFVYGDLLQFLQKPVSVPDILALAKTTTAVAQLMQLLQNHNIPSIIAQSQSKFNFDQIGMILTQKATAQSPEGKLEQVLMLSKTKFDTAGIQVLFQAGFNIDQIISLGNSKLDATSIVQLKMLGPGFDEVTVLGNTGYTVSEINALNAKVNSKNTDFSLNMQFNATTLFGTRRYRFEQAMILLDSVYFLKVTRNLTQLAAITSSYSFEDIIFLAGKQSDSEILATNAIAGSAPIDLRLDRLGNPHWFKISLWIPEWRKAVEEIQEEIAEWRELYAFPQEYDHVNEAVESLNLELRKVDTLAQSAWGFSLKIVRPGSGDADLEKFYAGEISKIVTEMQRIVSAARNAGPTSAAMSALGRAAGRDGATAAREHASVSDATRSLYALLKVGEPGKDATSVPEVFQPTNETSAPPKGVLLNKGSKSTPISKKAEFDGDPVTLRGIISQLPAPPDPGNRKVVYEGPAKRKDRGAGQASAMGGLNAATYAFALGMIQGAGVTDWEWLHIRSAGLGGGTNSKNLLPGLSSANTLMIPFENNLKHLSQMSSRQRPLTVNFLVDNQHPQSDGHAYRYIKVNWKFGDNASQDNLQKGEATFDIVAGRVVTKGDIQVLEKFLKQQRSDMKF